MLPSELGAETRQYLQMSKRCSRHLAVIKPPSRAHDGALGIGPAQAQLPILSHSPAGI